MIEVRGNQYPVPPPARQSPRRKPPCFPCNAVNGPNLAGISTRRQSMQSGGSGVLICHWNGRFGNRLHQYAYASEYAYRFEVPLLLPSEWEGCHLFEQQPHTIVADPTLRLYLNQTHPSLDNLPARAAAIARYNDSTGAQFGTPIPTLPSRCGLGSRPSSSIACAPTTRPSSTGCPACG